MFDPAGDALQRGRMLRHGYERAETLKLAKALEAVLNKRLGCEVIVARTLGEEKLPMHVPMFANRLQVDLFVNLSMYHEASSKPKVFFYQLTYNPLIDFAPRSWKYPMFVPIEQAHFKNINTTKQMGTMATNFLQEHHSKLLDVFGLFGIPLKSLVGVVSPGLLIEIGIHDDDQWESLVNPLAESLFLLLQK